MSRTVAIIPARWASSRFPGKPLADIKGKPMIIWTMEQAQQACDTVYVATDDQRIFDTVTQAGGNAVMTAPELRNGTERIAQALEFIEKEQGTFDFCINIQGDEPFIKPEQIQSLNNAIISSKADIATLIKKIDKKEELFDSNKPKVTVAKDFKALYFSRSTIPHIREHESESWLANHTFYKHIGIYAFKASVLKEIVKLPEGVLENAEMLEQLRWLENGYSIQTTTTDFQSLSVDTPEDLEILLQQL